MSCGRVWMLFEIRRVRLNAASAQARVMMVRVDGGVVGVWFDRGASAVRLVD